MAGSAPDLTAWTGSSSLSARMYVWTMFPVFTFLLLRASPTATTTTAEPLSREAPLYKTTPWGLFPARTIPVVLNMLTPSYGVGQRAGSWRSAALNHSQPHDGAGEFHTGESNPQGAARHHAAWTERVP